MSIEQKEKELEVLKAEAAFSKKKKSGKVTQKDKAKLRELRRDFRENHRGPKPGAQPDTIKAKAKAE